MRQRTDVFGQHTAVILNISGANLEQVIETRRDHVALFDLWHGQNRLVEGLKRGLAGVGKPHLDKGNMGLAHADRIAIGALAGDNAAVFQPFHTGLGRGF